MKPRKFAMLKGAAAVATEPLHAVILNGLVMLIEWSGKISDTFPCIGSEYTDYYRKISADHCPGYYCSFSENYMIEDETAAVPFSAPENEIIRDVFNWSIVPVCANIRDLALLYRDREDVRDLVNKMIEGVSSDEKEKRTFQNVLSRADFMTDFEIDKFREMIIQDHRNMCS